MRDGANGRVREAWTLGAAGGGAAAADRFDRQRRVAGWDQARLERAHVLVAGAGAIGNEAAKLLALLGIGRITIVDMDRIEHSNLARTVLFREDDVGRPKAEVAAERVRELAPGARVEAIAGDVERDIGLGRVREADAILGCLDNLHARVALNRAAQRARRPWIDAAIDARALEVAAFVPGGACYECALGERAWQRYRRRYSCGEGLVRAAAEGKVATVSTVASLAAALQVEALLALLHTRGGGACPGSPLFGLSPGERLFFSLEPLLLARRAIARVPDCFAHEPWPDPVVSPLSRRASLADVAAHLERERTQAGARVAALALGFDLVVRLACAACRTTEAPLVPRGRLTRVEGLCPSCRADRTVECVQEVGIDGELARLPLGRLGVPDRDILRLRTAGAAAGAEDIFVELAPEVSEGDEDRRSLS